MPTYQLLKEDNPKVCMGPALAEQLVYERTAFSYDPTGYEGSPTITVFGIPRTTTARLLSNLHADGTIHQLD